MEPVIQITGLKKSYGEREALKQVDLQVSKGICFGLLGPNGAGKTTTMKIMAGIIEADHGEVIIYDKSIEEHRSLIQQQIGYVPQGITLYEELSGQDNLRFFGEMVGLKGGKRDQRVKELLDLTGLTDRRRDPVSSYSGGMQRRINLAIALLHEPQFLILDEPTVGIDPQSRNHIFELVKQLKQQGVTVVYSTHYMEEVEALCDQVAIMDQGQVIAEGPLEWLLLQHSRQSIYVEFVTTHPFTSTAHEWHPDGEGWVLMTENITQSIDQLAQLTKEEECEIQHLELIRPSLEQVFLSLTGSTLRD